MITKRKSWWVVEYYDQERPRRRPVHTFVRKASSEEQAIEKTGPQPEHWLCEAKPLPTPETPGEIGNPSLFILTAFCVAYFCYQMLTWAKPTALEWMTAGLLLFTMICIGGAMVFESRMAHGQKLYRWHNSRHQAANCPKTSNH